MSDLQKIGEPKAIFDDWLLEVSKDLKRRGSFWTPTLTTSSLRSRTVVLRALEFQDNQTRTRPRFIIHTDIRSQKWHDLNVESHGCLHFYCPKRKWQMIAHFKASLSHKDPDSLIEWKRLSANSKRIYSLKNSPGIEIENPSEAYSFADIESGYDNFGVLTLSPLSLESLQLERPNGPDCHVRAHWNLQTVTFKYLAP